MKEIANFWGFTLAEVLITLGIIGVVAALTIPALINRTQDLEFKSSFKKIYAQLDQVTRQISNDNNGSMLSPYINDPTYLNKCGIHSWPTNANCFRDLYASYLNVAEKCDDQASGVMNNGVNCWTAESWHNPASAPGDPSSLYDANRGGGLVLTNGATVIIVNYPYGGLTTASARGSVKIDVNGNNPPNVWGRDYFGAYITDKGLVPFGANGDSWGTAAQQQLCNQGGAACSADVILNK